MNANKIMANLDNPFNLRSILFIVHINSECCSEGSFGKLRINCYIQFNWKRNFELSVATGDAISTEVCH